MGERAPNQAPSSDPTLLQLLLMLPPAAPPATASLNGSTPASCHGAAGKMAALVTHCWALAASKKACQSAEPFFRVSGSPTTTRPRRGRVMATFSLRRSDTKPMRPD